MWIWWDTHDQQYDTSWFRVNSNDLAVPPHWESSFILRESPPFHDHHSGEWNIIIYPDSRYYGKLCINGIWIESYEMVLLYAILGTRKLGIWHKNGFNPWITDEPVSELLQGQGQWWVWIPKLVVSIGPFDGWYPKRAILYRLPGLFVSTRVVPLFMRTGTRHRKWQPHGTKKLYPLVNKHSYWKWPFTCMVSFPIEPVIFQWSCWFTRGYQV